MDENQLEYSDILTDIVTETQLTQANGGKRFLNFIIDYVSFLVLIFFGAMITEIISPGTVTKYVDDTRSGYDIVQRIITMILYAFYMSAIEAITKGRSLGKIITGTKAVNDDGSNIGSGTAFKRGFSRIVPFEIFTALGSPSYPWHDKWNHTYVIDIKKSSIISPVDEIAG